MKSLTHGHRGVSIHHFESKLMYSCFRTRAEFCLTNIFLLDVCTLAQYQFPTIHWLQLLKFHWLKTWHFASIYYTSFDKFTFCVCPLHDDKNQPINIVTNLSYCKRSISFVEKMIVIKLRYQRSKFSMESYLPVLIWRQGLREYSTVLAQLRLAITFITTVSQGLQS